MPESQDHERRITRLEIDSEHEKARLTETRADVEKHHDEADRRYDEQQKRFIAMLISITVSCLIMAATAGVAVSRLIGQ